ncbi:hypothetical protein J7E91_20585 [Streptomyces sp. ISL-99]|uniref:hypothetical protein n=1 Tax=Streptomyces sp. ISL-99 TaxID=2819193 RepID=UPI001BEA85E9|nr:hypothetical protein [Streptomyces sp. ISL-99]MBT2527755.1 hypothetical protein [Streptomyces sp. ISL-99]
MTKLLLSIHVLAAILVVGPIAVAASLFPRYARQSASSGEESDERAAGIAALLHRICRGYAIAGVAVPVFGIATGAQLGVLTDAWLIASLALTVIAAAVLVLAILPSQQRLLTPPPHPDPPPHSHSAGHDGPPPTATRLTMLTGIFNLLWAIVVVLMIVRPGSTTGA